MTAISNDKLMELLMKVSSDVGEIKGQGSTFISQMKVQDDRATALEGRVRSVENRQHWYSGAAAILGAIAGVFGSHLKA